MIYHVRGDALTSIKFINGFGGALKTVSLGAGAQHAEISYNTADGTVAAVLAFASKRNSSHPLYSGVWNAKGVNLAPNGAREVIFAKSGEVLSAK